MTQYARPQRRRLAVSEPSPFGGPADLSVFSTIAHELRGPLHALAMSAEMLAQDAALMAPHEVQGHASGIHRRALWLEGLVENLLCAATVQQGRLQLHRRPLDIAEVVEEIRTVTAPLLGSRGQRLRVSVPDTLGEVNADGRRLGQVLVNLLLNASKYSPAKSEISLEVKVLVRLPGRAATRRQPDPPGSPASPHTARRDHRQSWVRFSVKDQGPGIPTEIQERLFVPFFRTPEAMRSGADGLGLGLAVVKAIAEAHDGQVGVENRSGGGAHFWVALPTNPPLPE